MGPSFLLYPLLDEFILAGSLSMILGRYCVNVACLTLANSYSLAGKVHAKYLKMQFSLVFHRFLAIYLLQQGQPQQRARV